MTWFIFVSKAFRLSILEGSEARVPPGVIKVIRSGSGGRERSAEREEGDAMVGRVEGRGKERDFRQD